MFEKIKENIGYPVYKKIFDEIIDPPNKDFCNWYIGPAHSRRIPSLKQLKDASRNKIKSVVKSLKC